MESSGKEKESRSLVFTSSTQREISHFHVVVVQRRQIIVQNRVMHVQSCCCFANLNLLFFCRSRCRRRRRCLSSLLLSLRRRLLSWGNLAERSEEKRLFSQAYIQSAHN